MALPHNNEPTQIPRVKSPVKAQKEEQENTHISNNIPNSAKKYVEYSQRRTTLHSAIERAENTAVSLQTEEVTENVSETTRTEDEPFRKRAYSLPGKLQRPNISINKMVKRTENEDQVDKRDSKSLNDNTCPDKTVKQYQRHQPVSPVRARRNNVYREEYLSRSPQPGQRSPQPGQKSPTLYYISNIKRPFQRRIYVPTVGQSVQRPVDDASPSPSPVPEGRASPMRQHLTRPARSNKIIRTREELKDELTVDEQVSEISSGSTHPSSSRHTNGSVNSNSGQTVLPSISASAAANKRST